MNEASSRVGSGRPIDASVSSAIRVPIGTWPPSPVFPMSCSRAPSRRASGSVVSSTASRSTGSSGSGAASIDDMPESAAVRCVSTVYRWYGSRWGRHRTAAHAGRNRAKQPESVQRVERAGGGLAGPEQPEERVADLRVPRHRVGHIHGLDPIQELGRNDRAGLGRPGEGVEDATRSQDRLSWHTRGVRAPCPPAREGVGQDPRDLSRVLEHRAHQAVLGDQPRLVDEPHRASDRGLMVEYEPVRASPRLQVQRTPDPGQELLGVLEGRALAVTERDALVRSRARATAPSGCRGARPRPP